MNYAARTGAYSASNLPADGDQDGDVDASDGLLVTDNFAVYSAWHLGPLVAEASIPSVLIGVAPQVLNLTISGSQSVHDPYSFDQHLGSGDQLRSVPVGGADTIAITFSEDVNVMPSHLHVVGLYTANVPTVAEFTYDVVNMTAIWRLEGWVLADQYVTTLSDAVTDVEGNPLDGEWTNPASLSTTNSAVSEFPSGDGQASGRFSFIATLLPGDANGDLTVSIADVSILTIHYGWTEAQFTIGDFNGDGYVYLEDLDLAFAQYGLELSLAA